MRPLNANFTKLFYGLAVSAIGNYVFDTTLILWISTRLLAGKSYAPAAVSGVLVAVSIGAFAIGPIAGVFVDRWDKRRTMMGSDLIRAVLVAVLIVVALLPSGTIPVAGTLALIYAVVLLSTAVSQFFNPASFTLIGDIVATDADRAKAASMTQAASYGAAVIGPPLAAPLLFTAGVYWALIINALSFVVSFLMVRSIRISAIEPAVIDITEVAQIPVTAAGEVETVAAESPGFLGEFTAGFRFVARTRVLRILLIAITIATLGTGALNALDVFFVTDNLHTNAHWYGTLGAGEGIGAIVGTIFAAWVCKRLGDVRVFCLGLTAVGVGLIVYARLDNIFAAVAVLAIVALPLGALNVASTPILLRTVPREMMGRTISVFGPLQQLSSMISALAAGWLVSTVMLNFHHSIGGIRFGRIDTVFLACGLLIVAGGLYATIGLRGSDSAPADDPAAGTETAVIEAARTDAAATEAAVTPAG